MVFQGVCAFHGMTLDDFELEFVCATTATGTTTTAATIIISYFISLVYFLVYIPLYIY